MSVDENLRPIKATALFASSQFLMGRVTFSALIALVAYIIGSRTWPQIYFLLLVICVFSQLYLNKNRSLETILGSRLLIWIRVSLSFFDTFMYSAGAVAIAQTDTALTGAFAGLIIMLTIIYVLMHYYMEPHLVLLLTAPCFFGLIFCLGGPHLLSMAIHDPWRASIPFLSAVFAWFFLSGTRSQLARARRALVKSRAEAVARAGEAIAASRSKSDFLATMGHEIRTPLNGVLGIAQVMSRGDLSADQHRQLNIIRESGETLLVILNDLLDISKIEAGKIELEVVTFSIRALARGVYATFSASASAKDLAFTLSIEDGADGLYQGDEVRLRQILYNLISNAVKFTDAGEVHVAIARREADLVLSVKDTGIGVPPSRQEALFDKFVQADASTTRRYGGTGLGLSIVSQLVQMMGGRLHLHSVEGEGSTFTVTIPLPRIADERDASPLQPQGPSQQIAATDEAPRILVAEDNATNQLVIKMMLAEAGVEPTIVANGQLAVTAWEAQPWDLIFMDIQMPEMDGLAATTHIRRRELETGRRRTPILALSANAMTHQRAEYIATGMDDLVSKPIDVAALFEALDRSLGPQPEVAEA